MLRLEGEEQNKRIAKQSENIDTLVTLMELLTNILQKSHKRRLNGLEEH